MKTIDWGFPSIAGDYNSTNSWGFAGSIGTKWIFPCHDLYVLVAQTSHRHGGTDSPLSTKFITVIYNGDRIFKKVQSPKNLAKAKELITILLTQKPVNHVNKTSSKTSR